MTEDDAFEYITTHQHSPGYEFTPNDPDRQDLGGTARLVIDERYDAACAVLRKALYELQCLRATR